MIDEEEIITELACLFETDPEPVLLAARERDVPLSEVLAAYLRTLRYLRQHGYEATANAPITDWDAHPPGTFDPRVVFQDEYWVDILRRPVRVGTMSPRYARNVIVHLHHRVHSMVEITGGGDAHEWLDQTALVTALTRRAEGLE